MLVPALAFAEACIGIGLLVSGILLVTVTALLYSSGAASLEVLLPLALVGATCGDHVGFYCGYWLEKRLHGLSWLQRYQKALDRGEALIRKYGAFAIFIGRFVPAIRSLLPALLGVSKYDRLRYSLYDIGACLLWSLGLGLITVGVDKLF